MRLFETVTDVERGREVLINRAYGVIEVCDQELHGIHLRPFPNLVSITEVHWSNFWRRHVNVASRADRVLLYYNQPRWHRNFISLSYFVSDNKSSLASIAVCLSVLDYIATLKQTDAIVTEITNQRIQDRHLEHFGWQRHLPDNRKRHWIKRFYGEYPARFLFHRIEHSRHQHATCHSTVPVETPTLVPSTPDSLPSAQVSLPVNHLTTPDSSQTDIQLQFPVHV